MGTARMLNLVPTKEGVSRDTHSLKSTLARDVSKGQIRAQCTTPVDEGSGNSYDPCLGNLEDKRDGLINCFDVGAKER